MRSADDAEAARAEGVAIAGEIVQRVRPLVAGVQLSAPFGAQAEGLCHMLLKTEIR
jgi:homocysteine S-methyltransferase